MRYRVHPSACSLLCLFSFLALFFAFALQSMHSPPPRLGGWKEQ
jgi:hypothetical protein